MDATEREKLVECIEKHKIDGFVFDCMTMDDIKTLLEVC